MSRVALSLAWASSWTSDFAGRLGGSGGGNRRDLMEVGLGERVLGETTGKKLEFCKTSLCNVSIDALLPEKT